MWDDDTLILNCNACSKQIDPKETCIRTLGNLYHVACKGALQLGTPLLMLNASEAANMSAEEFRRRTSTDR